MTMTDNPLAALLRDVPIRGRINAGRKCLDELVSKKDVLAALTLPDMDEVVKVLERLRSVHSATDCEAAADLITALLSQRAADAARIKWLEANVEAGDLVNGLEKNRAEAAEARIAALTATVERIAKAWPLVRDTDCTGGELAAAIDEIDAAITEETHDR